MRVAIVQAAAVDESLALAEAGGVLRAAGHELRLFLQAHERDFVGAVEGFRPDVLVVQAAFMAEPWLAAALALLPRQIPRVLVGTAATFDDSLLQRMDADVALQGELDDTLPLLLDVLSAGGDVATVPGVVRLVDGEPVVTPWTSGPPDLEPRALPARDLYFDRYRFLGRFPWKRFQTGRGCVHSCGFCYLPGLREAYGGSKANVRRKSVGRVIQEIEAVRSRWPLRRVHFADDLFAPSRAWLEELADRYPREIGIPFSANTSPETVTEANAKLLARAGARVIGIGLETGSERNRTESLGRPTKDDAIRRAASRLKAEGIQLLTFNMLANPGESFDESLSTLSLNQELGTDFPRVNLAYPTEGSLLQRLMREAGREPPPPDAFSRGEWRAWCAEGDPAQFEILQRLFRLSVRWGVPPSVVSHLARRGRRSLFQPLGFYDAWVEFRWSGVGLLDAARYAARAGKPNRRVTYHESLP